jgi:hypothetical protein
MLTKCCITNSDLIVYLLRGEELKPGRAEEKPTLCQVTYMPLADEVGNPRFHCV